MGVRGRGAEVGDPPVHRHPFVCMKLIEYFYALKRNFKKK